ncbi:hypothetical protein [Streptomyces sp. NK08204]|uniref:hypothetical protein n=1 Tax=Streptomyces sp. NK08204 TaxID=2873260 RepID=UPI001CED8C4C|nr:hypothetical protein [Streptomyces sp. NK08204]
MAGALQVLSPSAVGWKQEQRPVFAVVPEAAGIGADAGDEAVGAGGGGVEAPQYGPARAVNRLPAAQAVLRTPS